MLTVLITISRPECVPIVRKNLEVIKIDSGMEVVIIADNPELKDLDDLGRVVHMGREAPIKYDWQGRRLRIADIYNRAREEVNGSTIFGLEDDTVLPDDFSLNDFRYAYDDDHIGILSAVQCGRWGNRYHGAWTVDHLQWPEELTSLDPQLNGMQPVDATGLYCFMVDGDLFRKARFHGNIAAGPDVWFGLGLRQQGYQNYVDTNIEVGHWTLRGVIYPSKNDPIMRVHKLGDMWKVDEIERTIKK